MSYAQDGNNDFAFIGGGATGLMTLIYFAQEIVEKKINLRGINLHLIDPDGFGNGGAAYKNLEAAYLLNSTRDEMSPWNLLEFHEYCIANGLGKNLQEFNKRADYGLFLKKKFQDVKEILQAHGATFIEHHHNASIRPSIKPESFTIVDENQKPILLDIPAQKIALTTGYGPNNNLSNLHGHTQYIHSVYDQNAIEKALADASNKNIVIAGSGTALYDWSFQNAKQALTKNLRVFSSNAKLLDVRDTSVEENETSQIPSFVGNGNIDSIEKLERAITNEFHRAAETQDRSPRRVALDIRKYLNTTLHNLSADTAGEFRRSAFATNLSHTATSVPETSHAKLRSLNPEFISERLNGNITFTSNNRFVITAGGQEYDADIIINATGHGRHNAPILEDLKAQNLVHLDPTSGTLKTAQDGISLVGCNIPYAGAATHYGTDGIESFAPKSSAIASSFVRIIQGGSHIPSPVDAQQKMQLTV